MIFSPNKFVDFFIRTAIGILVGLAFGVLLSEGTFAVLGNHDYWTNAEAVRAMLRLSGITDLTNTVVTLTRENSNLHLGGVDDIKEGDVRLNDVTGQLNGNGAAILLVHEPDFADTSAATGKFDSWASSMAALSSFS